MYIYISLSIHIYIYIYMYACLLIQLPTIVSICLQDGWLAFDARLQIWQGASPAAPEGGDGDALTAGRLVPGLLTAKSGHGPQRECLIRMVPSSREQRNQLTVLTRELRQWMQQSGANRALVLRRTVATVCLVLPETPRTLAQSVASNFSPGNYY